MSVGGDLLFKERQLISYRSYITTKSALVSFSPASKVAN